MAALACEIARRLQLPVDFVCEAALWHHADRAHVPEDGFERLIQDLQSLNLAVTQPAPQPSVLDPLAAATIEVAHAFEQGIELAPYEARSVAEILDEIDVLDFDPKPAQALRSMGLSQPQVPADLAAYPAVLSRALALLRREDVSFADVGRLCQSDQVLGSSLLSVANAALYSPLTPIKTIGRAIAHIGVEAVKKIILTVAARPLFASSKLRILWQHSLEVATIAERLARTTNRLDPGEAFVAGLVHDIGRLAMESLPREAIETHHRIAEDAQCVVLADMAVIGMDHGEFGMRVIEKWGLPGDLVSAVRLHHRPELADQLMPSLLYLAEFVSESDEDIPSAIRMKIAMKAVGVPNMGDLFERSAFDRRIAAVLAAAV